MTRMIDGIEVAELYTSADLPVLLAGAAPVGSARRWQIRQRHTGPDAGTVNAAVLDDLAGGVDAIELHNLAADDLAEAISGVLLDVAPISLSANADGAGAWALMDLWAGVDVNACAGSFGIDPLGVGGRWDAGAEAAVVAAAVVSAERFPLVRSVGVDATTHGDVPPGLELGLSMATAAEYLRALDAGGLSIDEASAELEFTYGASADQFVTIAKLRAARALWYRVVSVCGGDPVRTRQRQRAITPPPRGDGSWNDVLRATTACFAAGAGGADAVTVIPFDHHSGEYSAALARRMARNTHHLLLAEAHVAEVADPGAGAPFIESLTHDLARRGWADFQAIEAFGGMGVAIESGMVADLRAARAVAPT